MVEVDIDPCHPQMLIGIIRDDEKRESLSKSSGKSNYADLWFALGPVVK